LNPKPTDAPLYRWLPSLPVWAQMTLIEPIVLFELTRLKQQLVALSAQTESADYQRKLQHYNHRLRQLSAQHKQNKQQRDRRRLQIKQQHKTSKLQQALQQESQQEGIERKRLKQERNQALQPLKAAIAHHQQQIKTLKQQYKTLSHDWQAQMRTAYELDQASTSLSLQPSIQKIIAQTSTPLNWRDLTEQLHTEPNALTDLCQQKPSVTNAGSNTDSSTNLLILYQDPHLAIIDKPTGLLSVPGRSYCKQDSVTARLRRQLSNPPFLQPAHRLDQATSGLLVIALSHTAHTALSQQFAQQKVKKTYEAILSSPIHLSQGTIDLPLQADPHHRPKQIVNQQTGKPSRTQFQRLTSGAQPRVELMPQTGRTHQLRVHAAHSSGLNASILGDALYGISDTANRLHLHAIALQLAHPITQQPLRFHSLAPF